MTQWSKGLIRSLLMLKGWSGPRCLCSSQTPSVTPKLKTVCNEIFGWHRGSWNSYHHLWEERKLVNFYHYLNSITCMARHEWNRKRTFRIKRHFGFSWNTAWPSVCGSRTGLACRFNRFLTYNSPKKYTKEKIRHRHNMLKKC